MANDKEVEDPFFAQVVSMADQMKLEGDEKNHYIDQCMTKAGYERVPKYVKPDQKGERGSKSAPGWFKDS